MTETGPKIGSRFKRWLLPAALVAIFIICGAYLRFHQLGAQSYWMDEGYTINAVLAIAQKGTSVLNSGQAYSCALYCYSTAWIAHVLGASAFAYRFFAALAGTLFILAIFFVVKDIFSQNIALVTSGLVAFSYWQIAWSRQARWYTLYELFLWLAFFFYLKWIAAPGSGTGRRAYYWWNGILAIGFTAAAIFIHMIGLLIPFLMFAWFIFTRAKHNKKWWWMFAAVVAVAAACAPFFIRHFPNISFSYELPYWASFYWRTYWPFILLSLVALWNRRAPYARALYFLFFVFLAYFAAFSFLTPVIEYRYLFALTPVLYIGPAIGSIDMIGKIRHTWLRYVLGAALLAAFFIGTFGVWRPVPFYNLESDDPATLPHRSYYAYTPQPDWNKAYAAIQAGLQPGDIVVSTQPQFTNIFLNQPGYWLSYDYLGGAAAAPVDILPDDTEYYVGAEAITSLSQLQQIVTTHHGYIVFDYMSLDGRIPLATIQWMVSVSTRVFYEQTNDYSQIWVYKF